MPICKRCKRNVEPDYYDRDSGLCFECEECLNDMAGNWVEITHEMALDAGDPDLEGQLVRW